MTNEDAWRIEGEAGRDYLRVLELLPPDGRMLSARIEEIIQQRESARSFAVQLEEDLSQANDRNATLESQLVRDRTSLGFALRAVRRYGGTAALEELVGEVNVHRTAAQESGAIPFDLRLMAYAEDLFGLAERIVTLKGNERRGVLSTEDQELHDEALGIIQAIQKGEGVKAIDFGSEPFDADKIAASTAVTLKEPGNYLVTYDPTGDVIEVRKIDGDVVSSELDKWARLAGRYQEALEAILSAIGAELEDLKPRIGNWAPAVNEVEKIARLALEEVPYPSMLEAIDAATAYLREAASHSSTSTEEPKTEAAGPRWARMKIGPRSMELDGKPFPWFIGRDSVAVYRPHGDKVKDYFEVRLTIMAESVEGPLPVFDFPPPPAAIEAEPGPIRYSKEQATSEYVGRILELKSAARLGLEALTKHELWCGFNAAAPGSPIRHEAIDALELALIGEQGRGPAIAEDRPERTFGRAGTNGRDMPEVGPGGPDEVIRRFTPEQIADAYRLEGTDREAFLRLAGVGAGDGFITESGVDLYPEGDAPDVEEPTDFEAYRLGFAYGRAAAERIVTLRRLFAGIEAGLREADR
jgi:hypothetical protein